MRPYAVIISFCLLLCASVGMYVLRQLEHSVVTSNESMNALVQSAVDRRLDELYRYSVTLELNNTNISLKTRSSIPQPISAPVYRLYDSIRDFVDSNALALGPVHLLSCSGLFCGQSGVLFRRCLSCAPNHPTAGAGWKMDQPADADRGAHSPAGSTLTN